MKLVFRQKIFSLFSERYEVKDEEGNIKFYIKPKFAILKEFKLLDTEGKVLHTVKKVFALFPKYHIFDENGSLVYTAIYKLKFLNPEFYILDNNGKEVLSIKGKILGLQYSMYEQNEMVAFTSKKIISLTDTYTLEILKEENQTICVLAALIFDTIYHDKKK